MLNSQTPCKHEASEVRYLSVKGMRCWEQQCLAPRQPAGHSEAIGPERRGQHGSNSDFHLVHGGGLVGITPCDHHLLFQTGSCMMPTSCTPSLPRTASALLWTRWFWELCPRCWRGSVDISYLYLAGMNFLDKVCVNWGVKTTNE